MSNDKKFERWDYSASRVPEYAPNGHALCRQCGKETPSKYRVFCSMACSKAFPHRSPGHMRKLVFERDKGVCSKCGVDTVWLASYFHSTVAGRSVWLSRLWLRCYHVPERVSRVRRSVNWWDADHITPVVEGGGGHSGLDNLRTLCIPCHQQETRELNRRRRERSEAKRRAVRG